MLADHLQIIIFFIQGFKELCDTELAFCRSLSGTYLYSKSFRWAKQDIILVGKSIHFSKLALK